MLKIKTEMKAMNPVSMDRNDLEIFNRIIEENFPKLMADTLI